MKSETSYRIAVVIGAILLLVILVQGLLTGVQLFRDTGDLTGLFLPVAVAFFVSFMLAGEWFNARGQ